MKQWAQRELFLSDMVAKDAETLPYEFIEELSPAVLVGRDREHRNVDRPLDENIAAGKNTYVYDAHTYHTKVPPEGIARVIDYYTNSGEIVLDPFCGSGMTGVAALERGRIPILSDLSPAAVFIARNFCTPIHHQRYLDAITDVLEQSKDLEQYLFSTNCRECGGTAPLLYTVWSYGLICSECGQEFILWDVARDEGQRVRDSKIRSEFDCPHCKSRVSKKHLQRTKRYPVQVGYDCCRSGRKEQTAPPNATDLAKIKEIDERGVPEDLWYPNDSFPVGINTRQAIAHGIDTVDKAYTTRALWAMAHLWQMASDYPDKTLRDKLLFTLTSLYKRITVFSEFRFWGGSGNTANFNVPQIMNEQNVFRAFKRKADTISWYFRDAPKVQRSFSVSVQSATDLSHIPDGAVDFVFTDPPFGGNINYSEMNFIWESWIGKHTNNQKEAIINKVQNKSAYDYQVLMLESFLEVSRILRSEGWMCVVFHNSSAKVWQVIQRAIVDAGFSVEAVQTFDKKHGTFKMFVSENAVGYDLVLHCRKEDHNQHRSNALPPASRSSVQRFVKQRLESDAGKYRISYQHVKREAELDYRRLYAEWLCSTFASESISIGFEAFRGIVDSVVRESIDE